MREKMLLFFPLLLHKFVLSKTFQSFSFLCSPSSFLIDDSLYLLNTEKMGVKVE